MLETRHAERIVGKHDLEAAEGAICPAHRNFAAETGGEGDTENFLTYLQDRWGSTGLLHRLFASHVRGNGPTIDVRDMGWSFVKDGWFSGVSRFGTNRETLDAIYAHLDPKGAPGDRSITTADLPKLAALLRKAFPREGLRGLLAREVGITMTTGEWALLIRAQGESTRRGDCALRQGVHEALLRGELPNGPVKRKVDVQHALPGVWGAIAGNFISTAAASAQTAIEKMGEGAKAR